MKKEIITSVLLVFLIGIVSKLHLFIDYIISQQYSKIAANQVDDDSTYTVLSSSQTTHLLNDYIFYAVILFTIFILFRIWYKKIKTLNFNG
jgi:hypothetical protein